MSSQNSSVSQLCNKQANETCILQTYQLGSLLASQRSGIVSLIPLPVWKAVDEDDAVLHQGLGSDQLVVGGVVDHVNDPGLACAACRQSAISKTSLPAAKQYYNHTFKMKTNVTHGKKASFSESLISPLAFSSRTGQSYPHGKMCTERNWSWY